MERAEEAFGGLAYAKIPADPRFLRTDANFEPPARLPMRQMSETGIFPYSFYRNFFFKKV
jgi:hypothetical protein